MRVLQRIGAQLLVTNRDAMPFFEGAVNLWLDAARQGGRGIDAIVASLALPS